MASKRPVKGATTSVSAATGELSITATIQSVVARRIKAHRGSRGLTQRSLAARLASLGVDMDQSRIARIERGTATVAVGEAIGFAVALEVPLESLLVPEEQHERVKVGKIEIDSTQFHNWLTWTNEISELIWELEKVGRELAAMLQMYERAIRVLAAAAQASTNPGVIQALSPRADRSSWLREADATVGAYERLSERAAELRQAARAYFENPLFPTRALEALRDAERRVPASQTYTRVAAEGIGSAVDRVFMNQAGQEQA